MTCLCGHEFYWCCLADFGGRHAATCTPVEQQSMFGFDLFGDGGFGTFGVPEPRPLFGDAAAGWTHGFERAPNPFGVERARAPHRAPSQEVAANLGCSRTDARMMIDAGVIPAPEPMPGLEPGLEPGLNAGTLPEPSMENTASELLMGSIHQAPGVQLV